MNNSNCAHGQNHGAIENCVVSRAVGILGGASGDSLVTIKTDLDDLLPALKPGEERLLPQPREGYSPRWRNFLFDRLQRNQ